MYFIKWVFEGITISMAWNGEFDGPIQNYIDSPYYEVVEVKEDEAV